MACNTFATEAIYSDQRIPAYQGNPLIEALPPSITDDDALLRALFSIPDYAVEQANWTKTERLQMISQLSSFTVPMQRHIELAQNLDAMIRQGYVGREPRTAASHQVFTRLYEQQKTGGTFRAPAGQITAQLSAALIGLPGMGKTTAIRRILRGYPEVIHHPELNLYQIPYLHIEMPYDGASVKGIAESIFRKVDMLLPGAGYGDRYSNARSGAETLMNHAARVLHMHSVGLLVVDELENLENSPKNRQALMTLLVSASNELRVPILFVGTNKAQNLLALDFRQARRSVGSASAYWGALAKGSPAEPDEWEDFLSVLWRFQWVKNPVQLTPFMSDLMFHHSQGIVDIAIKLFAVAQVRAIHDGTETLTGELIDSVAHKQLATVRPMIAALRNDDVTALLNCKDICPIGLDAIIANVGSGYSGKKVRAAAILQDNPMFAQTVQEALTVVGFDTADAQVLAEQVKDAPNALTGVQEALKLSSSGKRAPAKKGKAAPPPEDFPVGDLRSAFNADVPGETVTDRMRSLGLVADVQRLLCA